MIMPLVLPLLWALVGPALPLPEQALPGPALTVPDLAPEIAMPGVPAPDVVVERDLLAGWHTVAGAAGGLALGTGAPLAVLGAGAGTLAYVYGQAFAGTLIGFGPALFALGTVTTMVGAAACLPPCGALLASTGAAWGAQKEGRNPLVPFVGGMPGMALGLTSLALAGVAAGIGVGGFTLAVPWLITVTAAVLIGLPAPAIAFIGANLADAMWPGIVANVARRREQQDEATPTEGSMAF